MADCVLMLAPIFPPQSNVGGFRPARFAKYLPQCGWKPVVLTMRPEAFWGSMVDPSFEALVAPGTTVIRTGAWHPPTAWVERLRKLRGAPASANPVPRDANWPTPPPPTWGDQLKRLPRLAFDAIKLAMTTPDHHFWWLVPAVRAALAAAKEHRPSVIFSTGPPQSVHVIARIIAGLTGLPWVMDLRDPWSRNPFEASHDYRARRSINVALERLCVRRAEGVILNTPELLEDFAEFYGPGWRDKYYVIPNGYDPELRPKVERFLAEAATTPRDTGASNTPLSVVHPGTIHGRRSLLPVLEAVEQLVREGRDVQFTQIGHVDQQEEAEAFIRSRDLSAHVELAGRRTHEETLRRMAAADVLVVIRQNSRFQLPAKTYEMLLFRKPILVLDDEMGAAGRFVSRNGLGAVADALDAAGIARGIEKAAALQKSNMPAAWDDLAARYDGRTQTRALANVFAEAVRRRMP